MSDLTPVDIIYLAWNRLEFTAATWRLLAANTNFDLVRRVIVYEDGSTDGTREWLDENIDLVPNAKLSYLGFNSPVETMNYYLFGNEDKTAERFVKLDNDIAVPPGWLDELLTCSARHPTIELLGMEAGQTSLPGRDGETLPVPGSRTITLCSHIGGVGLMDRSAFRRPMRSRGRFGFTEFQHHYKPTRAWITPDLLVPQLDRVPIDPWASLSRMYFERGWQRQWPKMDATWAAPYYDWLPA